MLGLSRSWSASVSGRPGFGFCRGLVSASLRAVGFRTSAVRRGFVSRVVGGPTFRFGLTDRFFGMACSPFFKTSGTAEASPSTCAACEAGPGAEASGVGLATPGSCLTNGGRCSRCCRSIFRLTGPALMASSDWGSAPLRRREELDAAVVEHCSAEREVRQLVVERRVDPLDESSDLLARVAAALL